MNNLELGAKAFSEKNHCLLETALSKFFLLVLYKDTERKLFLQFFFLILVCFMFMKTWNDRISFYIDTIDGLKSACNS